VHVTGCQRNKGCGPDCKRIKVKGVYEAHILIRIPGQKPVRRRPMIPSEFSRTATERETWSQRAEQEVKDELARDGRKDITVAELVAEWLEERRAMNIACLIDEAPRLMRHVVPHLGSIKIADVRPRHALELVLKLKKLPSPKGGQLAPRTIREIYFTIKQVFQYAVIHEYIQGNPIAVERKHLPKDVDKDPTWREGARFKVEEVEQLIFDHRIPEHRRVRYAVEFLASLRTGQASALRWEDYEEDAQPLGRLSSGRTFDSRRKRIKDGTKTSVVHRIPVHPVLAEVLSDWRMSGWREWMGRPPRTDDLILPTRAGKARTASFARALFHQDLERLGLRKRRHYDTRRTFISLALDGGGRKDLVEQITHPRPKDCFDLYRTPSWEALSEQVLCIRVRHPGAQSAPTKALNLSKNGARMAPGGGAANSAAETAT
jgi:hypothetical protein